MSLHVVFVNNFFSPLLGEVIHIHHRVFWKIQKSIKNTVKIAPWQFYGSYLTYNHVLGGRRKRKRQCAFMECLPGTGLSRLIYAISFNLLNNLTWNVLPSPFTRGWNWSWELCLGWTSCSVQRSVCPTLKFRVLFTNNSDLFSSLLCLAQALKYELSFPNIWE